jgi:phosphate:Na+ symporter
MTLTIALNAAGGLGIFLLAMAMMTEGLKVFGGQNLKRILERWTAHPLLAAGSGAMVTAVVQSSSAVTVATIGFVNAGILTLTQSLGVIIGSNVGTTMTGWLVSLTGFGFKIEALALPLIALGMGGRLGARSKGHRGLGEAVAGFGLFFLGLAILKEAFSGVADVFGTTTLAGDGTGAIVVFVIVGAAATVLTQSSSAAIALILTAAAEGALGLGAAAAAIIGANVGTTSTAAFAALGATPNARRVAAGHIGFNVVTGAVALLLLPLLLAALRMVGGVVGFEGNPAATLALFHTAFNVLGAALLLPFVGVAAKQLGRLFLTEEEDLTRPRFLDRTIIQAPDLAVGALRQEIMRMAELVQTSALAATHGGTRVSRAAEHRADALVQLGFAVQEFSIRVRMEGMSRESAEALPIKIRTTRYLEEAARLTVDLNELAVAIRSVESLPVGKDLHHLIETLRVCLGEGQKDEDGPAAQQSAQALAVAQDAFEGAYQVAKKALLQCAADRTLPIEPVDRLLDLLSCSRRLVDQYVKARLLLGAELAGAAPALTGEVA